MPLEGGATFAGFTIVRLLGSGGMGEVYLAEHPRLPRMDAIKVLPAGVSNDPGFRVRFNREVDLAATLWHPHIVGVHDRGEYEGQLWVAMDFVDGADAGRILAERFPRGMPAHRVAPIVTAMADALDYAHKRGLVHRDVKPANIMLAEPEGDGGQRILLADFGIARTVDEISGLTTTNMTVGTVVYSAPEQLTGEDNIDGRADQYALAATAYHLLTGSLLFPHSNPAVVIGRHLNSRPPALADTHAHLVALDRTLATALAKNPDDRFSCCLDFAQQFAAIAGVRSARFHAAPTVAARAAIKPAGGDEQKAERCRRPWLVAGAVAATVLLGAAAMLLWRPWQPGHTDTAPSSSVTAALATPDVSVSTTSPPPAPPAPPPPTTLSPTHTPDPTTTLASPEPSLGPCGRGTFGMVSVAPSGDSYALCTGAGWVHIDYPLVTDSPCARMGTVGPNEGGAYYTLCTPAGWVDVYRPVCADWGEIMFKGPEGFVC